jgi:hypothetical protein
VAGSRLDQLRDLVSRAAARDADLQHALEALAVDTLKDLGAGDDPPVWAEIEVADKARRVGPSFVLADGWLQGELVIPVSPEQTCAVGVLLRGVAHQQHEACLRGELSRTLVIDPVDPKARAAARQKFADHFFDALVQQIRTRVAFHEE